MIDVVVFGNVDMTWRGFMDHDEHVLVATKLSSWKFLCVTPFDEYETVEPEPKPTAVPTVWKHDRVKVTCKLCLAVLDGEEVIEKRTVPL